MPKEWELGWAGGIVDGEGGVYVTRNSERTRPRNQKPSYGIRVMVGSTSLFLLERFSEIVGGLGIIRYRKPAAPNRKSVYVFDSGSKNAYRICVLLTPYLVLKRRHCELAMEAFRLIPKVGSQRNENRAALHRLYEESRRLTKTGPTQADNEARRLIEQDAQLSLEISEMIDGLPK